MALTKSRQQRLRMLEKEIRAGMEEFYYAGMKLKEIRDDHLYEEDGFETWDFYCRSRWDWDRHYVHRLITASEYRKKLPALPSGQHEWSERSVRELTRIPNKQDAARVAAKVIKAVEQSGKQPAKNPGVKPIKLSSSTVRKFVDEDLGIDRAAKARETKKQRDQGVELRDYIYQHTGSNEGVLCALQTISEDGWVWLIDDDPQLVERFITSCTSLADFLRKAGLSDPQPDGDGRSDS